MDRASFAQRATARVEFGLDLPDGPVSVASDLDVRADEGEFTVQIDLVASEGDHQVIRRTWSRTLPRDLA